MSRKQIHKALLEHMKSGDSTMNDSVVAELYAAWHGNESEAEDYDLEEIEEWCQSLI